MRLAALILITCFTSASEALEMQLRQQQKLPHNAQVLVRGAVFLVGPR